MDEARLLIVLHSFAYPKTYLFLSNTQESTWVWNVDMEGQMHELFMDKGEPFRFRVERLDFRDAGPLSVATQGKSAAFTIYVWSYL